MEEGERLVLRRLRLKFVEELRLEPLWETLRHKGLFSAAMEEEIQRSGSRRDQARQLIIDLETRGKRALPLFISCLRETGQSHLADLLMEGCLQTQGTSPSPSFPEDLAPERDPRRHPKGDQTSKYLPFPVQAMDQRPQEPARDVRPGQGPGGERPRRNSETAYILKNRPCGYCLIINNVNFGNGSPLGVRLGSDVDCEKLEKRFRSLCFEVLIRRDLKAQEIASELQNLAKRDHGSLDCCLVVILSHGCQTSHVRFPGGIYGTDGRRLAVEKMVGFFDGTHSPSLRGKPKIFFIQACGGEERDRGFQVDFEDSPDGQRSERTLESDATPFQVRTADADDEPDAIASLPTPSDILVSYSTFPGFVSWRDKLTGSWYVETLDRVLEQYARSEDLLDMLLRVADAVSAKGTFKQMPGCFNFLRKRFFFMVE